MNALILSALLSAVLGAPFEDLAPPPLMFTRLPLSILLSHNVPVVEPRVVGGDVVQANSLNFQISLQRRSFAGFSHSCGGSVYSEHFIVDAAHCVDGTEASSLLVVAGEHSLSSQSGFEQSRLVKSITLHPHYDRNTLENDVSILELVSPLDFSSGKVGPIELGREDVEPDTMVTVSGWGALLSDGSSLPDLLHKVDVPVLSNEDCSQLYGDEAIKATVICAGLLLGGKDSCQGDSGGPLFTSDPFTLVGIVSWGYGCAAAGYPGVYTRVAAFADFIESIAASVASIDISGTPNPTNDCYNVDNEPACLQIL